MLDQPLDEFKAEAGESVPVGNHKFELIAAMKSLQYGSQSGTLPIESAGDIGDDFSVRVDGPHVSNLSVEVCSLLAGTDSAIADSDGFGNPVQVGINVVQSLTCGVAVIGDFALACISSQRLRV